MPTTMERWEPRNGSTPVGVTEILETIVSGSPGFNLTRDSSAPVHRFGETVESDEIHTRVYQRACQGESVFLDDVFTAGMMIKFHYDLRRGVAEISISTCDINKAIHRRGFGKILSEIRRRTYAARQA